MDELKPCPFCGGKAVMRDLPRKRLFKKIDTFEYVRCTTCAATSPVCYSVELARMAWNRRADDD